MLRPAGLLLVAGIVVLPALADSFSLTDMQVRLIHRGENEFAGLAGVETANVELKTVTGTQAHPFRHAEISIDLPSGPVPFVDAAGHASNLISLDRRQDAEGAVRFAFAKLNGEKTTMMFIARRVPRPWRPSPVTVSIYRLENAPGGPQFRQIRSATAKGLYCNADKALDREWDLDLPIDYIGADTADGCFAYPPASADPPRGHRKNRFVPGWMTILPKGADTSNRIDWTPSPAQVKDFEKKLEARLRSRLGQDTQYLYRQYAGLTDEKKPVIFAHIFWSESFKSEDRGTTIANPFALAWRTQEYVSPITDSGDSEFFASYDPRRKIITSVSNGGVA